MAVKRNKCYYDVSLAVPDTVGSAFFRATIFYLTQRTVGSVSQERYGGFLQDFAAITSAGGAAAVRAAKAVTALFQQNAVGGDTPSAPANVNCTIIAPNGNFVDDPAQERQLAVRILVNRLVTVGFAQTSITGVLYVQRQHSIEV